MRSKRLLTMLLTLCLLVSMVSPAAAFATTVSEDSYVGAQAEEAVEAKNDASPYENDLVLSGEDSQVAGQKNLRDDPLVIPEVETPETGKGNGTWSATEADVEPSVSLTLSETPDCIQELQEAAEVFAATDKVTAFVVMEESPLAEKFSSIAEIVAANEKSLLDMQDAVIEQIEKMVLKGEELYVRYQFTYLTNSFSIETEFQNLEKIAQMDNVKSVFIMPVYEAVPVQTASPLTESAGEMTGVAQVWQDLGYTGKGMKIAVIDTGLDLDHPSFAAEPETTDTSLTIADIDAVLKDLNAYAKRSTITGKTLYRSAKVPYAFNYVDESLTADHSADSQGDHGTHVAGIAAANAVEGSGVVGMAPDAQLIIMKVFGASGGAYTDDIVAALEDAMTLGCDVVNLSLGSPAGFTSSDTEIDLIYERLNSQDIIATISAGNEGTSSYDNMWGTDLNRTQNPDNATVGSPGIYVNATTVASADNAVVPTNYFTVADGTKVFYMNPYNYYYGLYDEEYAGDYEYVVVDGLGEEADFYDEEGNSLVEGKVAVVQRGTINFATKIFNAQDAGAVACLIWDNVTEDIFSFGMQIVDDDGNYPSIPAALISLEDGQMMDDAETKSLTLTTKTAGRENSTGGQVSSFSSWGVAPDLTLEPDITGIGGSVYSCYDGGSYGLMSGTSMSAPQVAGVAALVMQYLHELYPNSPDGSIRDMAEALMMSTADPIIDSDSGVEASPRQQGAGLVDAYEATTTTAYLTVDGNSPKAQLGDSSTGKYAFSFEIHNFGNEEKTYVLDASLLTEVAASGYGEYFMYGIDMELSGSVTFDKETVTVPAGDKKNVKVTIQLSDDDKAYFQQCWENGGYVEGYVYLYTETEDGGLVSELNLPFLGFYGDWTDAPVFDSAYWYDNSFWGAGDGSVEGDEYWHVMWTDLAGSSWVLGFNPYSGAYVDGNYNIVYDESHNVVSPNGDGALDGLSDMYLSLLRNAKTLTLTYTDAEGNVLYRETSTNNSKTMYRSSYGQVVPWLYSWYGSGMYDFKGLENNTQVTLTIDATVDYETGGNHSISIPITVDTEVPELVNVYEIEQDGTYYLVVEAKDNTALAAAYVMNPAGTQIYASAYDYEMVATENDTYLALFDVTEKGTEFLVAICDYGANEGYYEVTYNAAGENLPVMPTDQLYAYRVFDNEIYSDHMYGWVSMDMDMTEDSAYANLSVWTDDYLEYAAINAAEYVDGKIFAVDAVYNLVVMDPGLFNRTTICNLGVNVLDMTFDDSTDTMYVLSKQGSYAYLYSMDLTTGELTQLKYYGYYTNSPWAIADDDNGTIYAIKYNSANIYTLDVEGGTYAMTAVTTTVDDVKSNVVIYDSNGSQAKPSAYAQSITYLDGTLYWAYYKYSYYGGSSDLIAINTTDWTSVAQPYAAMAYDSDYNLVQYNPVTELVGLLTLTDTEYTIPEATELTDLVLSDEELILTVGDTAIVTASPLPWNYEIGELTWTSSDESVATVVGGRITGVGAGKATITVSADGIEKTIAVTVVEVDGNVYAYNYYSSDGYYGYMIDVDLGTMDYSLTAASPVDFIAGDYNGHDGYFYGYSEGGQFWRYDMENDKAEKLGEPVINVPVDMAYDYSTGLLYGATTDYNTGASAIVVINMTNGQQDVVVDLGYNSALTLACDEEGTLYIITGAGELYAIDVTTGEPTLVLEGLGSLYYMQSMCWDYQNEVLIWACVENTSLYWINVNEGYAIALGDPTGAGTFEFVGMYTVPATIPELPQVAVESVTAENMMMLKGVTKYPEVTVRPFNATNKTLEMTSSDSAVVAVNKDGTLTAVAEGVATVSYTLADGENTFAGSFTVTVIEAADDVYGHVMTDVATYGGQYWVRLYAQDPSDPDLLSSSYYTIYAEEYYDGKLYALGYDPNDWEANWQFFVMNPTTHVIESQTEMGEGYPFVYDMTYDYTTSTMYAVAGATDTDSDLYMMNMETGELIQVMQTAQFFMSLAAAEDGTLYAMENSQEIESEDSWDPWASAEYGNATLYKINPSAGTVELVGETDQKCNMMASMSYDYDTETLYWTPLFQGSTISSGLCMVDTETAMTTNLGSIGSAGAQVCGLYIISENFPEEAEPALHNMIVTPAKTSVATGSTVTVKANTVPLSLDAETVWTSSDESVATVDENGVVTGVAQGKAVITATVTYGDVTMTDTCAVAVLDADAAFLTYNTTDGGWATINRADGTVTNVTEGEEIAAAAVASIGSVVYGYDVENTFFTLTLNEEDAEKPVTYTAVGAVDTAAAIAEYLTMVGYTEEEVEAESEYYAFEVRDLAYDAANDRLLALGNVYDAEWGEVNYGNAIYEVDMETGKLTKLYTFMDIYNVMAMTADTAGNVYYFNAYNDYVTKLDLTTGETKSIVTLQSQSYYGDTESDHALYYDDLTGLIYHLFTANGTYYRLFTVDPTSGALNLVISHVGEDAFAGLTYVEEHVHEYGEWTVTTEATCTTAGEKIRECECGEFETEVIPALGHTYGEPVFVWAEDNTCTATVACACGEVKAVEVTVSSVTTEPTCTEDGKTVYTAVSGEYSDTKEVVIPATGHNFEGGSCTICGADDPDSVPAEPVKPGVSSWFEKWFGSWWGSGDEEEEECEHSYTSVVTDPTCTEKGYTTHTCEKCGDSYKDSYVDATGHNYVDGVCETCGAKKSTSIWDWLTKWFR